MLGPKECSRYRKSEDPHLTPGGYCEVSHRETKCAGDIGICKDLAALRKYLLKRKRKHEPNRNIHRSGLLDLPLVLAGFLEKKAFRLPRNPVIGGWFGN
jgi:hypothetical protein